MSRYVIRMYCAVAAGFTLIGLGLAPAYGASAARPGSSVRTAQSATICCDVPAVAATSTRNAWVVGYTGGGGQALIAHWNGIS